MTRRKLTPEQVEAVLASDEPNAALARRYGVGSRTIRDVRDGNSYRKAQAGLRSPGSRRCVCGVLFKPLGRWNYLCQPCSDRANAGGGLPEDWIAAGGDGVDDWIEVSPNASDRENELPARQPTASMAAKRKRVRTGQQRFVKREAALDRAMELDGDD